MMLCVQCQNGSEYSGSIKCGELLDKPRSR